MNSNIFENADIVSDFGLKFSDFEDRHKYATIMTLILLSSDKVKTMVLLDLLELL